MSRSGVPSSTSAHMLQDGQPMANAKNDTTHSMALQDIALATDRASDTGSNRDFKTGPRIAKTVRDHRQSRAPRMSRTAINFLVDVSLLLTFLNSLA